jgi:hypothetical protein
MDRALAIHLPRASPAGAAPATAQFTGLTNVHDEFTRRLADQSDVADKMDTKTGVLVALLAGAAGLATAGGADILGTKLHAQTILVIVLILSLLSALFSLWPRPWLKPPNPGDYARYVLWSSDSAHLAILESLYAAIVINAATIASKVRWLDWCFRLLTAAGAIFGLAVVSHIEHWMGN